MFGISFLSPIFLGAAIAAAVPIVLHLFRRRTDLVIDFPSIRLLDQAPIERQRRRRLREIILLILRVTALVLLALSFARPYVAIALAPLTAPVTVVAVDTSMSLSAPGQFARARDAAKEAVRLAPASDAVSLVAFDDSASIIVPPTTDRGAMSAAIDKLNAGSGGTRYRTALARISDVIGAREGRVVFVTDLQRAGWEASDQGGLPVGVTTQVVSIPSPKANLAVTFAERRERVVVATVQNYGASPVATTAKLVFDGKTIAEQPLTIPPQSATDVQLSGEIPRSGSAVVTVDDAAGFQADNVRYLTLDPKPALPITVVVADPAGSSGGLYLERALSVAGRGQQFRVDAVDGRALSSLDDHTMASRAAVFLVGTRTVDRRGRALLSTYLQQGGQVFLTLGPDVDLASLGDVLGGDLGVVGDPVRPQTAVALVPSDARHPIFRAFSSPSGALGDVVVNQFRRLQEQHGRTVLARFSGGEIALTEQPVARGRLLVFTSDLDNQWGRFPLNPSFVPFVIETARYLSSGRLPRQTWVLPDVPPGAPPQPGITTIQSPDGSRHMVAVNVDVRESDTSVGTVEEFESAIGRVARSQTQSPLSDARQAEDQQRWWQVGLLVMLIALSGEAIVGRKAT
ncbi:MAG: vWA domain-containing protein [Vicinamibacterales bacterium]